MGRAYTLKCRYCGRVFKGPCQRDYCDAECRMLARGEIEAAKAAEGGKRAGEATLAAREWRQEMLGRKRAEREMRARLAARDAAYAAWEAANGVAPRVETAGGRTVETRGSRVGGTVRRSDFVVLRG